MRQKIRKTMIGMKDFGDLVTLFIYKKINSFLLNGTSILSLKKLQLIGSKIIFSFRWKN